jgi:hypothetical protein
MHTRYIILATVYYSRENSAQHFRKKIELQIIVKHVDEAWSESVPIAFTHVRFITPRTVPYEFVRN